MATWQNGLTAYDYNGFLAGFPEKELVDYEKAESSYMMQYKMRNNTGFKIVYNDLKRPVPFWCCIRNWGKEFNGLDFIL